MNRPDKDLVERNFVNPLHLAIFYGDLKAAEDYLNDGDPDEVDGTLAQTPLIVAMYVASPPMINLILKHSPNLDYTDLDGMTALHYAVFDDYFIAVKMLIEAGASASISTNLTPNSLFYCHSTRTLKALMMSPTLNLDGVDFEGNNFLHIVAMNQVPEMLSLLLTRVDPDVINDERVTPLHYAAAWSSKICVKILINTGATIDFADWEGNTPLHYAMKYKNYGSADQLIELGADPDIQNLKGISAGDIPE